MGADIEAWVEYDDTAVWHPEWADDPPFSHSSDDACIPLTDYGGFRWSKDYRFFAAISGARCLTTDPKFLFELRGLPPNLSSDFERSTGKYFDRTDSRLSWLTLTEIRRALAHMNVDPEHIAIETYIVLDIMQVLEKRFGVDCARLIFLVED